MSVSGPADRSGAAPGDGAEDGEQIELDADLVGVIGLRAFRARLVNGHEFVAYGGPGGRAPVGIGDRVRVRFSPYDMAKARMVGGSKEDEAET